MLLKPNQILITDDKKIIFIDSRNPRIVDLLSGKDIRMIERTDETFEVFFSPKKKGIRKRFIFISRISKGFFLELGRYSPFKIYKIKGKERTGDGFLHYKIQDFSPYNPGGGFKANLFFKDNNSEKFEGIWKDLRRYDVDLSIFQRQIKRLKGLRIFELENGTHLFFGEKRYFRSHPYTEQEEEDTDCSSSSSSSSDDEADIKQFVNKREEIILERSKKYSNKWRRFNIVKNFYDIDHSERFEFAKKQEYKDSYYYLSLLIKITSSKDLKICSLGCLVNTYF